MTAFLGPLGDLRPIQCHSSQGVSGGRSVTFSDTMTRRKAFVGRASQRIWDCGFNVARPPGIARLQWLADYGQPPFVWYSPDAVVSNVLPPSVAALSIGAHNGVEGPSVEVEPGLWVKSATPAAGGSIALPFRSGFLDPVAVIPGLPITVSAWLRGGDTRITVAWRDLGGATFASEGSPSVSRTSLARVSCTWTPPAGAAQATFTLFGVQVAGPSVSFTAAATPYGPGKGCKRAVVHGLSESLILATEQSTLSSAQFTVTEVG